MAHLQLFYSGRESFTPKPTYISNYPSLSPIFTNQGNHKSMNYQQRTSSFSLFSFLILTLILTKFTHIVRFADAGKTKIHITDDLDDVIDEEEDEEWKEWGKKSKSEEFDPPPEDISKMEFSEIQAEMMKRQTGPAFGFVKLRPGFKRTPDMITDMAMKWTRVLRTGALEVKFMGVDLSTIMLTMEKGQDAAELKEFVLSQPEAYEIKIGDQVFRRPGDPPLDEVFEKLRNEKNKADDDVSAATEDDTHEKDEL